MMQTINAIVTTLVEYFRNFDMNKAGEFVNMIVSNFNADTIKLTFKEFGEFVKDVYAMIKG
ncbi:MAG: hypothetical protein MJ120_03825 [Clostridia bacterium]|nr:hypothetical protein [Clostridia bacterium]